MSVSEIIQFKEIRNSTGCLVALEQLQNIPFEIKRVYYLFDLSPQAVRGQHAHKKTIKY